MAPAGAHEAEIAAEGFIARAAKDLLRPAVGAAGRPVAAAAERDGARGAATAAEKDLAHTGENAAERHVNLDELPGYHSGGEIDPAGAGNIPADYKPYGDLSRQEFYDKHYDPNKWGEGQADWDYPKDDGFDGPRSPNTLQEGDVIDRYGRPSGHYTSPVDTPFEDRGLPPTNLTQEYHQYRVKKALPPEVTEGRIAPAFEQKGGGVQHFFPKHLEDYIPEYLEPL